MPPASHSRLKSLESLTGFGLFRNFIWDAAQIDDFNQFNVVYGWNYSGKTTLSRAFQCLEDGSLHGDFTGGAFRFSKGDGTTVNSTFVGPRPTVRVFNRHFVQRNFRDGSDMTGANVIAVLGEANQALKDRLADLETRLSRVDAFRTRLRDDKAAIQQKIDDDGTAQARIVNGIVGGPYDRRHLAATISSLPNHSWPIPLTDGELDDKKEQFRKATDFSDVDIFAPSHSALVTSVFKVRQALSEIATNAAIATLRGNQDLEDWVQTGLDLNAADSPCGFCGATVSQARWEELQGHFSEAFAALQTKLRGLRSTIEALNFDAPTDIGTSLFPDERAQFQTALADLRTCLSNAKNSTDAIKAVLDSKLAALETPVTWQPIRVSLSRKTLATSDLNPVKSE